MTNKPQRLPLTPDDIEWATKIAQEIKAKELMQDSTPISRSQRYGQMIMDSKGFDTYPYLGSELVHIEGDVYGIRFWDDTHETQVLAAIVPDEKSLPYALALLLSTIPYQLWIHSDDYVMGYAGAIIAPYGAIKCKLPDTFDLFQLDPMYELMVSAAESKAERQAHSMKPAPETSQPRKRERGS